MLEGKEEPEHQGMGMACQPIHHLEDRLGQEGETAEKWAEQYPGG
jgi:hypothetical protein